MLAFVNVCLLCKHTLLFAYALPYALRLHTVERNPACSKRGSVFAARVSQTRDRVCAYAGLVS